jgi:hypothetical protein
MEMEELLANLITASFARRGLGMILIIWQGKSIESFRKIKYPAHS